MRFLPIFSLILLPIAPLYAQTITVHRKSYTGVAGHMMKDDGHNALYRVPLEDVENYLRKTQKIKRKTIKLMAKRVIPGKTPLSLARHYSREHGTSSRQMSAKELFSSLQPEKKHTYVILNDVLIFTETANNPKGDKLKDALTKHYLLADFGKEVRFSGEMEVYINNISGEIFAVFDNSSGTYKPDAQFLPGLLQLLDNTFNSSEEIANERVHIVTKRYNQKIDNAKLFAHEAEPYLQN